MRKDLLKEPLKDIQVGKDQSLLDLYTSFREIGGFTAPMIARATDYIVEMFKDNDALTLMSFTANLVATGLRGVIVQLIKDKLVDVIFTTGGTIDHDIARSSGGKYYKGRFNYDDEMLRKLEIHRLGNVLVPLESYGPIIEKFTLNALEELQSKKEVWGIRELLHELGRFIKDENSILRQAYLNDVPIYSPGVVDSSFGTALLTFREGLRLKNKGKFILDPIKDLKELSDIILSAKRLGGIVLGGGISKHHLIWWSQFKGGLDYAVYITTAVEWDGSLSGAQTREAISWGKIKPRSKHITVYGDVTVIFPLIMNFVYSKQ